MVRIVFLPSQLLQSKMSLWWEVVSYQVNFLKVRCGHGEICYPVMSTSWNTMLPRWVILSWQVNFFKVRCCHGEKCYLAKSTFIVKMLPYLWYYVVMFWKISGYLYKWNFTSMLPYAPDCSRLQFSPNIQSGKYNEMDPFWLAQLFLKSLTPTLLRSFERAQ